MQITPVQNCQQTSIGTLGIPNCTVLGAVLAKCLFHPVLHLEVSHRFALYLLSIPSHSTMGGIGIVQTVPFATTCPYCPSHPGKEWTDWDHTKFICYALYLPSIPSWEGMDRLGSFQIHLLCPVPTVHPIPLYHGRDWTDEGCTKVSHLLCPVHCTYCPSHPTVPWEGMDRMELYQKCPICYGMYSAPKQESKTLKLLAAVVDTHIKCVGKVHKRN